MYSLDGISIIQLVLRYCTKEFSRAVGVSTYKVIDLILTNHLDDVGALSIEPGLGNSDHNAVFFAVECNRPRELKAPRLIYRYNLADFDVFRDKLAKAPWDSVFLREEDDVDVIWDKWSCIFESVVRSVIPSKRFKPNNNLPWIMPAASRLIRKKKRLWRLAKSCDKESVWVKCKKCRNYMKTMISRCRDEYISLVASQSSSNPKRFWVFTNSVLRRHNTTGVLKTPGGSLITSSAEKAEAFNRFFHSVFIESESVPDTSYHHPSSTPVLSQVSPD